MPDRQTPPFRADHVGSLLRPPEVRRAREDFRAGRIDAAALRAVEDEAIREAVRKQEEIGLKAVTDGPSAEQVKRENTQRQQPVSKNRKKKGSR